MNDTWTEVHFPDAVDFKEGPGIMARDFRAEGVPLIRLAGVKPGAHILAGCNYLDPQMVAKKWSHFRLCEGDVILSTSASLGEVAIVTPAGVGAIPYTGLIRMRGRPEILDQRFLPWVLRAPDFARQVRAMGVGSVMNHFGPSHLRQMTLRLPSMVQQRRIAGVLGALDDLIETNWVLIRLLNALRRAVWAGGHGTARRVGEVAYLGTERTTPQDVDPDSPYLGLEHFAVDGGGLTSVGLARDLDSQKSVFHPGDTLYGKLRPYFRKVARPDFGGICSTEIWVLRPAPGIDPEFLEYVVSSEGFTDHAMSGSSGTRMPRASWEHVSRMTIEVPDREDMARLSDLTRPMWAQSWALNSENQLLSRIRDELLPLLMSGRVRVREVAA